MFDFGEDRPLALVATVAIGLGPREFPHNDLAGRDVLPTHPQIAEARRLAKSLRDAFARAGGPEVMPIADIIEGSPHHLVTLVRGRPTGICGSTHRGDVEAGGPEGLGDRPAGHGQRLGADRRSQAVRRQAVKFPTRIGPRSAARLDRLLGPQGAP